MKIQSYQYNNVNNFNKRQQNVRFGASWNTSRIVTEEFVKIMDMGYPSRFLTQFLKNNLHTAEQAQTLLDLRNIAFEKLDVLSSHHHKVGNEDLENLFFLEPRKVLNTVKILGKKSFVSSFCNKYENVENCIQTVGAIDTQHPLYQKLLELTNPRESFRYQTTQTDIARLKMKYQTTENRAALIKRINELTDENKNLVKKSLTDYPEKIELAEFFSMMQNSDENLVAILDSYGKQDKHVLQNFLNDIVRKNSHGKICKQVDFRKNKYLQKLITANDAFKITFKRMLSILNQKPTESVGKVLLDLPQNKETKKQFEEIGVNFDRWTTCDSNLKVQKNVEGESRQEDLIKHLEQILNSPLFNILSEYKKQKFYKEMTASGYQLKTKGVMPFQFLAAPNAVKGLMKLYKDDRPISFNDLSPLIDLLTNFMKKDSVWNGADKSMQAGLAKKTIENSIKDIKPRISLATLEPRTNDAQITVQQVDMNNVAHSLFLGNDASCCMSIGSGFKQDIAPNYIMNKMLSAIEILIDGKNVGNTMCYIAEINKKPALVLDNVELKQECRNSNLNDAIRDSIIEYAKKYAKELGVDEMSVYAGFKRNKVSLRDYSLGYEDARIVGTSGDDVIYIDSIPKQDKFNDEQRYRILLYRIGEPKPKQSNTDEKKSAIINCRLHQ